MLAYLVRRLGYAVIMVVIVSFVGRYARSERPGP
jgi:hypothetical protein